MRSSLTTAAVITTICSPKIDRDLININVLLLVPLVVNLHAKFEVFSYSRSRDMEMVPKFEK